MGRVDLGGNPCQKVDFQKLLPGAILKWITQLVQLDPSIPV